MQIFTSIVYIYIYIKYTLDSILKSGDITDKGPSSQSYGFSSSHVWLWELDHKESWAPKNWCFWTVVLEKTLESPLDCKEIKPVHPKINQSWICIGRTEYEAEAPILWPPDTENRLIGKDPDAGKDWKQGEKEMTENEMVWWHHQLNGHEFEQTPGVADGQGSLTWCSPWGRKEWDMTEWLNWTEPIIYIHTHKHIHPRISQWWWWFLFPFYSFWKSIKVLIFFPPEIVNIIFTIRKDHKYFHERKMIKYNSETG